MMWSCGAERSELLRGDSGIPDLLKRSKSAGPAHLLQTPPPPQGALSPLPPARPVCFPAVFAIAIDSQGLC